MGAATRRLSPAAAEGETVNDCERDLALRLDRLRQQGLHRELRRVDSAQGPHLEIAGRLLLNFSSNDYLGLTNHPTLKAAAIRAVEQWGAGSGSARLVCGSLAPHHELEAALAAFKGTPAALTFSSGYATVVGTLGALLGKDDIVILDKRVHACVVDAARLCGAKLRVFAHNDLDNLEAKLQWARSPARPTLPAARVLIVTESIFSMDGDQAPLRELVELKDRYGAWLMVDEAHATGLYGAHGSGLAGHAGVGGRIEIQMGTLGKALGAAGGYVAGAQVLVELLVHRARSFIFSTAPVPAQAAAARAAVQLVQSAEGAQLRERVWALAKLTAQATAAAGWTAPAAAGAIVPLIVGDEARAVALAARLRELGLYLPAIRYPTVARGAARLRLTLTAAHNTADIAALATALRSLNHE
jgi:8-amino-7-oxononanoate synthase